MTREMAHLALGAGAVFDLQDFQSADFRKEQLCNQAAAEFLLSRNAPDKMSTKFSDGTESHGFTVHHLEACPIVAHYRKIAPGPTRFCALIMRKCLADLGAALLFPRIIAGLTAQDLWDW
jgi:Zn-dependent peptidase ImmA (M78 family)